MLFQPLNGSAPPSYAQDSDATDPVVDFLVSNGADINQEDKYGLTPLHYAAMRGNELAMKQLLSYSDVNVEVSMS